MTTMFYKGLIMVIALINTIQVELENDIKNLSNIDERHQPTTDNKNNKQLHDEFKSNQQNNEKHEKLYNEITDAILKPINFLRNYTNKTVELKLLIKKNYEEDFVKKLCENKKRELAKKIEDKSLVLAFVCAFDMFVENLTFTINTFNEIAILRTENKDDDEVFREKLIGDEKLFENFILSLNWIYNFSSNKLNKNSNERNYSYVELEFTLLHNFDSIEVKDSFDENFYEMRIFYNSYNESLSQDKQDILNAINEVMQSFYTEKMVDTRQDIFKHENTKTFIEYYKSNKIEYKDEDEKKFKSMVKIAFNAIVMHQSSSIQKIDFIGKKRAYYKKENDQDHVYLYFSKQQINLTDMLLDKLDDNSKYLKFDVLSMHTTQNIVNICMLSVLLDSNVEDLKNYAENFFDALLGFKKGRHNKAISTFFDDLSDKSENQLVLGDIERAKESCTTSNNAIKKPIKEIKEKTLAEKLQKYVETDFLKQYKKELNSIFERIRMVEIKTKSTADHVYEMYAETEKLLEFEDERKDYFIKILDIIKYHDRIKFEMENLKTNEKQTFRDIIHNLNLINNKTKTEEMQPKEANNANKNKTKILNKLEVIPYIAKENKMLDEIIYNNRFKITNIVNDTIMLKTMINEAEKLAIIILSKI